MMELTTMKIKARRASKIEENSRMNLETRKRGRNSRSPSSQAVGEVGESLPDCFVQRLTG